MTPVHLLAGKVAACRPWPAGVCGYCHEVPLSPILTFPCLKSSAATRHTRLRSRPGAKGDPRFARDIAMAPGSTRARWDQQYPRARSAPGLFLEGWHQCRLVSSLPWCNLGSWAHVMFDKHP